MYEKMRMEREGVKGNEELFYQRGRYTFRNKPAQNNHNCMRYRLASKITYK